MPSCVILSCNNNSSKNNVSNGGISYHRFPNEPSLKEIWMNATGRQNWFPTKTSTICSEHFQEKQFILKKSGRRYLVDTAIPDQNVLHFQPDDNPNPQFKRKVDSEPIAGTSSPKRREKNESNHSSAASTPRKFKLRRIIRWNESTIRKKDLKIKKLEARNRRLKKKNAKLEEILRTLEEKFSMDSENLTNLKNINVKD